MAINPATSGWYRRSTAASAVAFEIKMKSKVISGTIALGYLSVAYFFKGSIWALKATGSMVLALACIWVSEAMGGYVGGVGRGRITAPTPAFFVALGGWILLVVTVIVGCVIMATT